MMKIIGDRDMKSENVQSECQPMFRSSNANNTQWLQPPLLIRPIGHGRVHSKVRCWRRFVRYARATHSLNSADLFVLLCNIGWRRHRFARGILIVVVCVPSCSLPTKSDSWHYFVRVNICLMSLVLCIVHEYVFKQSARVASKQAHKYTWMV